MPPVTYWVRRRSGDWRRQLELSSKPKSRKITPVGNTGRSVLLPVIQIISEQPLRLEVEPKRLGAIPAVCVASVRSEVDGLPSLV